MSECRELCCAVSWTQFCAVVALAGLMVKVVLDLREVGE